VTDQKGALDDMLGELLKTLIPEWSKGTVEQYAEAVGLLATLKDGVVVGGLRLAINVTPYDPDEEE
jgi:hypothetical protein